MYRRLLCIFVFGLVLNLLCLSSSSHAARETFVVTDMDGKEHNISSLINDGKSVAFVFWQTWCSSCRKESPNIVDASRKYESAIRVFGVISGPDEYVSDDKVRRSIEDWQLPYPQIRDRDLALTKRYGVRGTPTIVIIGEGGETLFYGHASPENWTRYLGGEF